MQKEKQSMTKITVQQIAAALGIARQVADRKLAGVPCEYESARGGRHKVYKPNDLPAEIQIPIWKWLGRQSMLAGDASPAQPVPAAEPERKRVPLTEAEIGTLAAKYESRPTKTKERAQRLLAMVRRYHALQGHGAKHTVAAAAVCGEFNLDHSTLCRHLQAVQGEPSHIWLYLLLDHFPGRTASAVMDPQAWEAFKGDFLRRERPSLSGCIARLRRMADVHQWKVPSNKTLERRIKAIRLAVRRLARCGEEAAQQTYPPQARDKSALAALQIINADGYKHNLWVKFPDGEIIRAKTWFWQDIYSNKIIGWRTDKTEHTDVIRLSYGDVVEQYGIPGRVVLDNTMAAANKTMSGGARRRFRFKVKDEEPLGVFALVGSEVKFTKVRHGQSKPVERTFGIGGIGETIDKAPEFAGAWTGANTLDKPDYDGKTRAIGVADLEKVIVREVAAMNAKPGRRSPIHAGRSWDEVFAESYAVTPIRRATEAQRRLWLLATEPVRANAKDGSITLDAGRIVRSQVMPTQANRYWAPALVDYAGQMVVARFDPSKLHEGVHIYSLDGRYIAFADCHAPQGFNDANAGREHNRARNAHVSATKKALAAERRMDALQAAKFLPGSEPTPADLSIPAPKVVRGEFRRPIEAPVVTDEDRAYMERLEAEDAAPRAKPIDMMNDQERFALWQCLRDRKAAGEELDPSLADFYAGFTHTARLFIEIENDLRLPAAGGQR